MDCFNMSQLIFSLVSLSICVVGCSGSSDALDMGKVAGHVTLDGQPLANAQIIFAPKDGRPSIGKTDEDGWYVLQYTGDREGALIGKHRVRITTHIDDYSDEVSGHVVKGRKEVLPEKYHRASILEANVVKGANNIDFDLDPN